MGGVHLKVLLVFAESEKHVNRRKAQFVINKQKVTF